MNAEYINNLLLQRTISQSDVQWIPFKTVSAHFAHEILYSF